jgi:hypothetical protein
LRGQGHRTQQFRPPGPDFSAGALVARRATGPARRGPAGRPRRRPRPGPPTAAGETGQLLTGDQVPPPPFGGDGIDGIDGGAVHGQAPEGSLGGRGELRLDQLHRPPDDARVVLAIPVSGKGVASPPLPPLRTVRESCPSYGSSRPLPSVLPGALSRMGRRVASGSVCRPSAGPHLTCPFGPSRPTRQLSGRPPGPRQPPFGAGREALSTGLWAPLAFRRVAFASWAFLFSLRVWAVLPKIVRLTGWGQTASGLPRSAPAETRRGRAPPLLRGLGAPARRRWRALTGSAARSGSEPSHRRVSHRLRRPYVTQPRTEVHSHSPVPSVPHPVGLDGSVSPWALPVCFHTPRCRGRLRGSRTDLGTGRGSGDSPTAAHLERLRVAPCFP